MSNDVKLELCPLCGGPAQIIAGAPGCYYVRCEGCSVTSDDGSRERVITKWNTRHQPQREAVLEQAAQRIYEHYKFGVWAPGEKPPWVPNGNSEMQYVARAFARTALKTTHAPTSEREAVLEEAARFVEQRIGDTFLLAEELRALKATPAPASEREAVLDEAVVRTFAEGLWAEARKRGEMRPEYMPPSRTDFLDEARKQLTSLTTPAPAVSRDDQAQREDVLEQALREALRPFAREARWISDAPDVMNKSWANTGLSYGDWHRAAAAIRNGDKT